MGEIDNVFSIYDGDYGIIEKDTDFILTEGDIDGLPTLFEQDDIYFEYNQNEFYWSKKSCTIYNAFGAVSDLMNYEFSRNEIRDIDLLSYTKGRKEGKGWWTNLAVDLMRNWWNSNELSKKYGKVASYKIDMRNDNLVKKILDKNYTICWSYEGNSSYTSDFYYDGILDNYEFGKKTYGHSTGLRKHEGKICIKDNYKGRNYNGLYTNFYELKPSCKQLVDAGTFRQNGYLFTKVSEDNYGELMRLEKTKVKCNNTLKANSELWEITNDMNLKKKLHDTNERIRNNNLKYIEEMLIKLK